MRDNTERLRPPRFLWVPFELGRPFGAPNTPGFQTEVLRAALALLERTDGPPILEDFLEDAPLQAGEDEMTGWSCPIALPPSRAEDAPALLAEVLAELRSLAPWHALARERRGRTGVGAAGVEIEASARFLHALLAGEGEADAPVAGLSLGQAFRGAAEDLKTFHMEAATARPGRATSSDLADWFWGETAAGRLLLALHPACLEAADAGVRRVADAQLVPRAQQHRVGTESKEDRS